MVFTMVLGAPMTTLAATWTVPEDASPGQVVEIHGDNSDGLMLYTPGDQVRVYVNHDQNDWSGYCDTTVQGADQATASWMCTVTLSEFPEIAVGSYTYKTYVYDSVNLIDIYKETGHFTDAAGSINKVYQHWSDEPLPGDWNNDILNANKSNYFEGEVVPHVFVYKASNNAPLTNGQSYAINVTYNYYQQNTNAGGFAFMTTYNISRQPGPLNATNPYIAPTIDSSFTNGGGMQGAFYTVDADITNVSAVTYLGAGSIDGYVTITFTYVGTTTTNGIAEIYYGLYIAKPGQVTDQGSGTTNGASAWTGGSLQTTVDIGGSGATSIQLSPAAVIAGKIAGYKWSDLNGNGAFDTGEPKLSGWTINLCADSACTTILQTTTTDSSGNFTFSVVPGTYYVREVVETGYRQTAPASVFYGPLVVSASTPQYLDNNFGNQQLGKIIVNKTATGGNAKFSYTTTGGDGFPTGFDITTSNGSGSQTFTNIVPGVYSVAETPLAGWTLTSSSCDSGTPGSFTVPAGGTVTCSFTNSFDTGSLKLTKSLSGGPAEYTGPFTIHYDCGVGFTGDVSVAAGSSQTVSGIPSGASCTISEPTLPTPPDGYSFGTPTFSPSATVTTSTGTTVEVTTNNTLVRDQGYLKISKVFDPKTSGFNGTFAIVYNCGAGDVTVSLAAGASTTVGPFDTGTSCAVSEPTLPTAPTGWTFGIPSISGSPATIVKGDQAAAVLVSVTNSITRDQGFLKISKIFDPLTSGFSGTFAIVYNCGGGDVTVNLAAGGSTTVGPFDTGTSCTVSEPTLPTAPTGWTFGSAVVSGSPATIVKGDQAAAVAVSVTNSITRDQGYLKISKSFDAKTSGFNGTFAIVYNCGSGDVTVDLAAGGSTTVGPFDTGTSCAVSEPTLPTAPTGWTFGSAEVSGSPAKIVKGDQAAAVLVSVTNSITRDLGNFKITKSTSNPDGAILPAAFTGTYDCGTGYTGSWSVADGASQTISGIPTGNVCSVAETAPVAIPGFTWGAANYTPATIVISTKGDTFEIVVGNSITRDRGSFKITKTTSNPDGATLPAAFTGTYDCGGTYNGVFSVADGASQTFGGIPTGSICSVVETAPDTIPGYTWGTITYTPATITIGTKGGTFEIVVGNSITRDRGNLKLSKAIVGGPAGYVGPFKINYDCDGTAYDGSVNVSADSPATISGIPTGTSCTISEVLPTPPAGYAFGAPAYSPSATVVITTKGETVDVTTTNYMGQDLTVTKTATATLSRTYKWLIDKSVNQTKINIPEGGTATFNYTVKVTPNGFTDSGFALAGTITIKNPNAWEAVSVDVADSLDQGGTCSITEAAPYIVPKAGSLTLHYTCATDGTTTQNTVTVTWDKAAYATPSGSASNAAAVSFGIAKETNKVITVVDDKTDPANPVTLGTSDYYTGPFEFTYSLDKQGVAGKCTDYTNTAVIDETDQSDLQTVTVCVGKDLTVTKTAAGTFDRTYLWKIEKLVDATTANIAAGGTATFNYTVNVDQTGFTDSGWKLAGVITISNPNNWEDITLTGLTDVVDNGGTCTVDPGVYVVPKSGSLLVNYICTYSLASSLSGNNTATATWDAADASTPSGSAKVNQGFMLAQAGATNKTVTVTDSLAGNLGSVTATDASPFATATFTYSHDFEGIGGKCTKYDNTATINETGLFAIQTVEVCVGQDLTVTKTAIPTFTRTWDWTITKDFDATYNLFAGSSVNHDYKVSVTPNMVDSLWKVVGTITISNPNTWEAIVANVFDVVDYGGTCTLDDPTQATVTVPASGSVDVDYTCTWSKAPSDYVGTNTATVTWDKALYFTPGDIASGTAGFEFTNPTEINPIITVDDNNLTGESWSTDSAYAEWTYTKDFACSTNPTNYKDGKYSYSLTNTAKINETGQTDKATVTVNCYAPVISKTAAGSYDERHEWKVEKSVNPTSQSAFIGDTVSYEWTVVVTEQTFEESFEVAGDISVVNPAPMAMTVDLADTLGDGTAGVIGTCTNGAYAAGKLTIPANTTATCQYTAKPEDRTDTVNNVTATLNAIEFPASASFDWTANVIRGSVTLDDDQNPAFPLTITDGSTWTYTEQYTCSTDKTAYDATTHKYTFGESNTATVKSGETLLDSSTASTSVNCYVPVISKDANGTYNEVHDWTLGKMVDPTSQSGFAGEQKNFTWTVTVGESVHDENINVSGKITVVNPNPEDALTVTLSDKLNDNTVATIGPCTGGTWSDPNLSVPAGGTAVCDYSVTPTGRYNLAALAAALPDQVTFKVSYPYGGGPAYFPVTTITGGPLNGTYEGWCIDTLHTIYENTNYTANVYSSYESLPVGLVDKPQNFDLVNWIINQDFVGKPAGGSLGSYTYSDVQYAIWTLLENQVSTSGLYDLNYTRAAQIVTLAQTKGENFMPTCGDMVAVVLQPVGGANQTITIAQVTFASLGVNCADTNVATAVLHGVSFPASAKILWTGNPIRATATLTDLQGPLNETLTGGKVFTIPDSYTCSTDPAAYTNGTYTYPESNTARLSTVAEPATANTEVKCYAPVVTKDVTTYWDRHWDWTIVKDYDGSYNLFAGDTVAHGYKVSVTPTKTDNLWGVKGNIKVYNFRPDADMTLSSLTDLAGGINGKVTCPSLVVPKAGSLACTYDTGPQTAPNANPFGDTNTATAVFAGVNWTGSANIAFSATPTTEKDPVITVDDDNLTGENWSADRAPGGWTYTKDFACSTNPADYTDGKYSYSHTNTAKINETGQTDTAKVDVTCYWPQIELTKTGDTLSKIGDGVTYTIKLENSTPTGAGLRDLSCTISDPTIGFNKTLTLASGASDSSTKSFTIPAGASDPFLNTASVTCKPVAATAPVVGSSTFSVSDSSEWSTNLFQPAVEIIKTGPLYVTSGDVIEFTFTINNQSSSDSPNLLLDSVSDNKLGDLKAAAVAGGCDNLVYNGTCTFKVSYTVPPAGLQTYKQTNVVTVHYHPAGFPNDITDTDDHTITVAPKSQLTDTSFCPLPNNQFRLLYRLYQAPNIYLLNGSNPGQFYFNAFYYGTPGSDFTMNIQIPYPFMTQEGAGNPIQVHDGTSLTSSGCYLPNPSLNGFTITTPAMTPTSSAGNQIITPEDYSTKQLGQVTTVTVSGKVPASGMAYVTIHLDYGLKKSQPWKPTGTFTTNPVNGASLGDLNNATGFGSGPVTIHGYEVYNFARTVGSDTSTSTPSSYNEIKKFAGFLGFVNQGDLIVQGATIKVYSPTNALLTTLTTDVDGYYLFAYKHTAKSATYKIVASYGTWTQTISVTVKANGFAAVDFEIP